MWDKNDYFSADQKFTSSTGKGIIKMMLIYKPLIKYYFVGKAFSKIVMACIILSVGMTLFINTGIMKR